MADPKIKLPDWLRTVLMLAVCGAAFVAGWYLMGGMMGENAPSAETTAATELSAETTEITELPTQPGPSYEEIFSSRGIQDTSEITEMDAASYVAVFDGVVEKQEFGYKKNTIHEIIHTIYYPIDGCTEEEKENLDAAFRENFASHEEQDFITVTYDEAMSGSYYVLKIHYTDLKQPVNVAVLNELGIVSGGPWLSMESTEAGMMENGYVKKN